MLGAGLGVQVLADLETQLLFFDDAFLFLGA
jgi:hypothetical protein